MLASGIAPASSDTLECLRIAAGVPWLGRELDQSVLPAEARLEAAISTSKGCYTGQEVVTRMRSRGRVGASAGRVALREPDAACARRRDQRAGRPDRAADEPRALPDEGAIGLGFVRAEAAEPGTSVRVAGAAARIVALPMRSSV